MKVIFSEEQIANRIREIGSQISRDYHDDEILAVGVMDDSFMFLADLVRTMSCPVTCHFMKIEARDTRVGTQEMRNIIYGPIDAVEGRNVLLVDVLVDSGITLDHLVQQLLLKRPKSVRTAALVNREDRRRLPFRVDYAGFEWAGEHLVGFGMESNGRYRNLPYVAAIPSNAPPAQAAATAKGGTVTQ